MDTADLRQYRFPPEMRLHGAREFAAVFDAKLRKNLGPITVCGRANQLGHLRLGLSVPRRVGTAVRRNRIKRLLREAFRLNQHDWPQGYDVVVVVRPHAPAALEDYQRMLASGIQHVHQERQRRQRSAPGG